MIFLSKKATLIKCYRLDFTGIFLRNLQQNENNILGFPAFFPLRSATQKDRENLSGFCEFPA